MEITVRKFAVSDLPFVKEMLYEAVYWRKSEGTPSIKEAMQNSDFLKAVRAFGEKSGDLAIIAESGSSPVGAVWIRYWKKEDEVRGFISADIPVLAIAVKEDCRHKGIGLKMIEALKAFAAEESINKISLCVSKDNFAYNLYKQCGFSIYNDIVDSFNMLVDI